MGAGNDPGGSDDVGEFSSSSDGDGEGPYDGARDRPEIWARGAVNVVSRENDKEGTC